MKKVKVYWPNGDSSTCIAGEDWLKAAHNANIEIQTGCLVGSCGACEIEVNGKVIRACISNVPEEEDLNVELFNDPYWN
tara:strand:- start:641 stop:877 length:237 start_codon:yes stop_codon:yes gene_type:complete